VTLPKAVATLGGVGLLRPAPGTWGSALVLPCALLGPVWCFALALVLIAAGFWSISRLADATHDPGWVVVDEGAGQLLALTALPFGPEWLGVPVAFILFRLLDIMKPGPVGWADRKGGTAGVMLDDLIAGAITAAVLMGLRVLGLTL
jgi:phosphatidylglycerophosphatase A